MRVGGFGCGLWLVGLEVQVQRLFELRGRG